MLMFDIYLSSAFFYLKKSTLITSLIEIHISLLEVFCLERRYLRCLIFNSHTTALLNNQTKEVRWQK